MSSLEDTQFSDPGLIDFLNGENQRRGWPLGINAENVHIYFMNSPFLDPMSNNAVQQTQGMHNPAIANMIWDRKAFEAQLARIAGIEYRVVDGPERSTPELVNPVWVIRKQLREKERGNQPDKITVEATYFVMGEYIFQAPSLEDMLRARVMAATRALNKFYDAAASLQFYTPDRGYSYHQPISKPKAITNLESTRTSRANSPIADTTSQTTQTLQPGTKEIQQGNDDRAIAASFSIALQWGSEYMDENPLIGEPGALKLSSTSRHLKDQQDRTQAEVAKALQQEKEKEGESTRASVSVAPTPAPIKTTDLKKGNLSSKSKSPVSAVPESGIKKRRKSKAPGTPGITSPS